MFYEKQLYFPTQKKFSEMSTLFHICSNLFNAGLNDSWMHLSASARSLLQYVVIEENCASHTCRWKGEKYFNVLFR